MSTVMVLTELKETTNCKGVKGTKYSKPRISKENGASLRNIKHWSYKK